jgi:hypothetical protein
MRIRAWREGVRAGVLDVFTAFPMHPFPGLWLEFKVGKNTLTKEQRIFMDEMERLAYRCEVVRSAEAALEIWADYLGFEVNISR